MFSSFNLEAFGDELKRLRHLSGLTQTDVQLLCGINPDTLRRLENGYVIPRYETLEILSHLYKADLLDILRIYRSDEKLYNYYNRLDSLISNYEVEILRNLSQDFDEFIEDRKDDLINPFSYDQFKNMIEGISQFYSTKLEERVESLNTFITALRQSIPTFTLNNYNDFNYNIIEKRILILIALGLSEDKKYELSNGYLTRVLNTMDLDKRVEINQSLLIIKIYIQLAYNFHNLSEDKNALKYANLGIKYSVEKNLMFGLYLLYYRKAVAELLLDKNNYMDSFRKSIMLLEIQNKMDLIKIYKDITFKNYGITI